MCNTKNNNIQRCNIAAVCMVAADSMRLTKPKTQMQNNNWRKLPTSFVHPKKKRKKKLFTVFFFIFFFACFIPFSSSHEPKIQFTFNLHFFKQFCPHTHFVQNSLSFSILHFDFSRYVRYKFIQFCLDDEWIKSQTFCYCVISI